MWCGWKSCLQVCRDEDAVAAVLAEGWADAADDPYHSRAPGGRRPQAAPVVRRQAPRRFRKPQRGKKRPRASPWAAAALLVGDMIVMGRMKTSKPGEETDR